MMEPPEGLIRKWLEANKERYEEGVELLDGEIEEFDESVLDDDEDENLDQIDNEKDEAVDECVRELVND